MTTVFPNIAGSTVYRHEAVYYALSESQMDTPADIRGYAVLLELRAKIIDPTDPCNRLRHFIYGPSYRLDLIEQEADALAYLAELDGTIDNEVVEQIELAHDLELPVYLIVGRELVLETVPVRLAA